MLVASLLCLSVPVRVIAFWSTDCPVARRYVDRLLALESRCLNEKADFQIVFPNSYETPETVSQWHKGVKIKSQTTRDANAAFATTLKVNVVPCIVVLDSTGTAIYNGPIDDNEDPVLAKRHFAQDALNAALKHEPFSPAAYPPIGCTISRVRETPLISKFTFQKDIFPIYKRACLPCHAPNGGAPLRLDRYQDARAWGTMTEHVLMNYSMPPYAKNNTEQRVNWHPAITRAERNKIMDWVAGAMPQGGPDSPFKPQPLASGIDLKAAKIEVATNGKFNEFWVQFRAEPQEVSGFALPWSDLTYLRDASIYQADRKTWLGTIAMGQKQLRYPANTAASLSNFWVKFRFYGNDLPLVRTPVIRVFPTHQASHLVTSQTLGTPPFTVLPEAIEEVAFTWKPVPKAHLIAVRPLTQSLDSLTRVEYSGGSEVLLPSGAKAWQPAFFFAKAPLAQNLRISMSLENSVLNRSNPHSPAKAMNQDEIQPIVELLLSRPR